jgi:hypothetical protein
MYQLYSAEHGADALVCFPFTQSEFIFPFRDKLTEALLKIGNLQVKRSEGYPLPPDSIFQFYAENEAVSVIETSHDFPCVVIHSRLHSEVTLSKLIQEIAKDLGIEIVRNPQLGPIAEVVTSNRSYNL